MLEPNELYTIADGMVKIYEKLNTWAVVDMAERIMEMQEYNWEELSGTTQHLAWCANQSGLHYQDMIKQIEKLTDISGKELHELFKESAVKSIINDNEAYKNHGIEKTGIKTWDDMSDSNKQMAENMYQRTNKTLKNFTKTTARSSQQQLHTALDTAFTEILMGYKSYDKAIADAIKKVGKKGTVVVYNSGYKDTLETCVRRAVMTGINQMAGQTSINNALEMGAEYVKVSKHSDARVNPNNKIADHKGWQGKVYKLDGEDKKYKNLLKETGFDYKGEESDPLGLCGYNCRHVMSPYFPEDEESDEDSEAEEEKMKKEEEEHERLAEERELTREITTLKRMSEAYEAALDRCMDEEIKKQVEAYNKQLEEQIKDFEEQSLRTKDGDYSVNWRIVKTKEYTERFNAISDNKKANELAAQRSRNALVNRDGKNTEELYAISLTTGKDISKITNQNHPFGVSRTEKFNNDIIRAEEKGEKVLFIHNHPRGLPPSEADVNELLNHKNAIGITVGHNGSIYIYTKPKKMIEESDKRVAMRKIKIYNGKIDEEEFMEVLSNIVGFEIIKL